MSKASYLLLVIVFLVSCASEKVGESGHDLGWLLEANPETDAKKAISSGDTRLIGLAGMFLKEVPRIDKDCDPGENVRYISIDDVVNSYEERKLQVIAPIFAETYNYYLMQYGKENNVEVCE